LRRLALATTLLVLSTLPATPTWADAGDRTIRFGLTFVSPSGSGTIEQSRRETIFTSPDEGTFVDLDTLLAVETGGAAGVGFGFEFLVTRSLGIDVRLGYSMHDVNLDVTGDLTVTPWTLDNDGNMVPDPDAAQSAELTGKQTGELTAVPLTLGLNIYVVRARSLDFYIGPMIGIVIFGDLDLDRGTLEADPPLYPVEDALQPVPVEIKESPALGVATGVDVWLGGGGWLLSVAARYLKVDARVQRGRQQTVPLDPWTIQVGVGYRF